MVLFSDPSITSVERDYNFEDDHEVPVTEMAKALFSIVEGQGEDVAKSIDLDTVR